MDYSFSEFRTYLSLLLFLYSFTLDLPDESLTHIEYNCKFSSLKYDNPKRENSNLTVAMGTVTDKTLSENIYIHTHTNIYIYIYIYTHYITLHSSKVCPCPVVLLHPKPCFSTCSFFIVNPRLVTHRLTPPMIHIWVFPSFMCVSGSYSSIIRDNLFLGIPFTCPNHRNGFLQNIFVSVPTHSFKPTATLTSLKAQVSVAIFR